MSDTPPPLPPGALAAPDDASGAAPARGEAIDDGRGRIFPCEECGADLEFHIGTQGLKCPYCGHEKQIAPIPGAEVREQDFSAMLERLKELRSQGAPDEPNQSEVRCESCGAGVVFVGTLTSLDCPYCGSPLQREKIHAAGSRLPVDGVLAFRIPREAAQQALSAWVRSRWFAPSEFRLWGVRGKFNGVYLPFWTYDSLTGVWYEGQRGEHYTETVGSGKNKRTVTRTRWYSVSGEFQQFFDDVIVLAARGMHRDLMHSLEPWPLHQCAPFRQEFLAGYLARTYDIPLEEGFDEARARMEAAIEAEVRRRIGGDEQRIDDLQIHYGAITFKHLLLPTWLLAYRFRNKPYQVMINAVTGEVQGERPYSWIKITLAVLAGAAAAAAAAYAIALMNS